MKKKEYNKLMTKIQEIKRQAKIHGHDIFKKCVRCKDKTKS